MAYYNNLLNMGEPVNVQPLPQPLLTSPFDYTDTGLLTRSIPSYAAPTPLPYTPIAPGPFGVQPVAPIAGNSFLDANEDTQADFDDIDTAGTMEPTMSNLGAIAGNLASLAMGPFGFTLGQFANIAAGRNTKNTNLISLALDVLGGDTGGFDGFGNYGTSGVDESAFQDAVTTAAFDAFGAAFDGPGTSGWDETISDLEDGVDPNEAPGGIDYSGEVGGDGDGGGDGDTHICTAAFRAGISPKERFRANKKYGIKLRREDPVLMRGYDIVGPWIAKKIGHTGAGEFLTKIYAKQTTGEKMTIRERILFAILSNTVRPALRVVGALC